MSKIYFICGFIGSGKTTYAKQLAHDKSAFRFSIDEWMIPLYGEHMQRDIFNKRLAILQGLFKDAARQMLGLGIPVIFDFGFWTQSDRDEMTRWASDNDIAYELIYLDVSFETCCLRAMERNKDQNNNAYQMTKQMLDLFWSWFEIPTDDSVKVMCNNTKV